MNADELAAIRAGLTEAKGVKYAVIRQLFAHIDTLTAVSVELAGKAEELEAERDAARAEAAALREHPKAYQIDGGSVHTVITTAQYEALRRVVDAEIVMVDYPRPIGRRWTNEEVTGYLDAKRERDAALAAYRAEWSR